MNKDSLITKEETIACHRFRIAQASARRKSGYREAAVYALKSASLARAVYQFRYWGKSA